MTQIVNSSDADGKAVDLVVTDDTFLLVKEYKELKNSIVELLAYLRSKQ